MRRVEGLEPTPLGVKLFTDDLAWLREEKRATGQSVNTMIARAVRQYVRQRKGVRARREGK